MADIEANADLYIDRVFESLRTEFLVMPKGRGFVEFETFDTGYEALKSATGSFGSFTSEAILPLVFAQPMALVVLRCILGLTPPEWAAIACEITDVTVPQGPARSLDRDIREFRSV